MLQITRWNRLFRQAKFETGIIKLHILQKMPLLGLSGRPVDTRCRQIHNKECFFSCLSNASAGSLQMTPLRELPKPMALESCSQHKMKLLSWFAVNLCNCSGRQYRSGEIFTLHCTVMLLLSLDCKLKAGFLVWSCQLRMKWIWMETNKKIHFKDCCFLQKNRFPALYAYFRLGPCKPQESNFYQISSAIFQFWKGRVLFWETFIPCSLHSCFQYWKFIF